MNIQAMQQTVKTMTSREVSGLCDKEHRHVLRDIDDLNVTYGEMALPKIGQCSYKAENGQNYKQYLLTQEHCVDLITGYSREIRIRINRRWQELETQASQPVAPTFQVPQTLGEALQLAGTLQLQIEQDAPKVAFHDTVSASKSTMAVGDVAKKIGM
jgi:phage regulator Rha-like protein